MLIKYSKVTLNLYHDNKMKLNLDYRHNCLTFRTIFFKGIENNFFVTFEPCKSKWNIIPNAPTCY